MKLNNLNFHQTFPPDESMISRLLTSDVFGVALTKEEISQKTGIPTGKSSGKVEPHVNYAQFMGLLEDCYSEGRHYLTLTKLGECVRDEDPTLSENVTRMVCHLRLTSIYGGASLWEVIMREILPQHSRGVSEEALLDSLKRGTKSVINLSPFFSSYDGMFASLELIKKNNNLVELLKHSFDDELIYVYSYELFLEWETSFPNHDEITAREIESMNAFNSIGWKEKELYFALEQMQDKGLVSFNRQLTPYTITKNYTSGEIIPKLYQELF